MNLKHEVPIYGDVKYRGKCPSESMEQVTFFNKIRREFPDSWGLVATHIKNEGKRTNNQVLKDKAEGLTTGVSDIIICGFHCELKRQDHTKCKISDQQIKYLETINKLGGFGCIALGYKAAFEAFQEYARTR